MLALSNIDFNYPRQTVFSDLNLIMKKGEFVFLIGKSGSGKSTLLQLIYFNILPFSGEVQFDKFNSKTIKTNQLPYLRRKLGIIFQDFKLLNDRNIYENLSFVLEAIGTSRKEIKRKVASALTDVGLFHRRFSFPNELSGGEKQRIAIARSIINEPYLILADEPTGNLDPETSSEIVDLLFKINARGTAVIFATHNYEIVKKYQQKIIKIERGRAIKAVLKQKN
ncbi:MAG: cell division ATP-binding protein FtsE [Ignavibacteria bacterium RIFOXYB2_FULL_35_12]|nr:MAG: cell division ATP-binding protein FtsE [Ignavibacteria bacterium GWA2_36_19]OGU50157.1 MAG: cell division ATP-binding protein FtsE [Ignavibacteria bacterium GWC2_35_8]OGU62196.1 MAG: cell division ATP-binding protein FtsE [Ignavibacteria bacterium GWF2_35_20]OGU83332.1 MAG: cell division ATP-binding protein FtsE [Ignavibacteria bacterium RIFOXYA2_FULL_35_9]OGU84602.1 MAG: cell division ATP-binding protein FtsE [Ignavibacteria bacterium RIFOXYA12_FULL_35_25]OGU96872.1 MAG: cell division